MTNIELNPSEYKILVVDDIVTNTMLLKAVLGRAKYKITTAGGGLEALEKVKQESPDLILLDIMMPDIDGYEVLRRLKNEPEYAAFRDIPVICLTALHNPEDIVKGFKCGASDYVAKP
ncbi:MAG: response regulator, partial [Alistipes sp.]